MRLLQKLLFAFFLLTAFSGIAKNQYEIEIKINHYPDSVLLLTSYYGDRIVLVDTAYATKPGMFLFAGAEKLPGGIYMAVSQGKQKLFEFVVDDAQQFSMTTDTTNYVTNLQAKSSPNNQIFFDYLKLNEVLYRTNKMLSDSIQTKQPGSLEYEKLKSKMDSVNKVAVEYKLNVIKKNPELFVSVLFTAMQEVKIPDSLENRNDSAAIYYYYKNHYWDYLNLSDSRFLRTPLLARKVDDFFKTLVVIHPDSAIAAVDETISLARPSNEVVSWLVWHFTSIYQNPEYMGFDKVFLHLVDEYFVKEEIQNVTPSVLESLTKRADQIRPLLLGSPAPNLILIDSTGNYKSFQSLTSEYIVLLFWDYDCGVCKKEIKVLKEIYNARNYDFEIYAINVNSDLEKWKKSLVENDFKWVNVNGTRSVTQDFHDLYDTHGTPEIFILDKKRNIVAKNISAGQLEMFFENQEKKSGGN